MLRKAIIALTFTTIATAVMAGHIRHLGQTSGPYPFAPPSDEFCQSNKLGDDSYMSFFVPCKFSFYDESNKNLPTHFSCNGYFDPVFTEERSVAMWPDSCVANGPRCYSIQDYPSLSNYTFYHDSDFAMEFPSNATIVSVDCAADFAKAVEFVDNLPDELKDVAGAVVFATFVQLFTVLAAIVACICCCVCRRRRQTPVANHYYNGPPVQATPYETTPLTKPAVAY